MIGKLPRRINPDAILDAFFEIRFDAESQPVPEIYIGRIADSDKWRTFQQSRLATADIPAPIRRADVNLRYQPTLEMTSPDGQISIRIGPNAIVYSRRGKYPGWSVFGPELEAATDHLFRAVPKLKVERLGLRYVNALKSGDHGIESIEDMDIKISVAGDALCDSLNLNFKTGAGTHFETMCRIATVDLAAGNIPDAATVIVDLDVYTAGADFEAAEAPSVKAWLADATVKKNELFFRVLGKEATERLRED